MVNGNGRLRDIQTKDPEVTFIIVDRGNTVDVVGICISLGNVVPTEYFFKKTIGNVIEIIFNSYIM